MNLTLQRAGRCAVAALVALAALGAPSATAAGLPSPAPTVGVAAPLPSPSLPGLPLPTPSASPALPVTTAPSAVSSILGSGESAAGATAGTAPAAPEHPTYQPSPDEQSSLPDEPGRLAYEQQQRVNLVKDQFLLNINHELRTPLTEVHGYLELLREYNGQLPADTQAVFIDNALHGCEELKHLINNVLDTVQVDSDLKPPSITKVFLAAEVREVLSCFDPRRWDAYTLHLDVPETLAVQADTQYLHCVLRNLFSNIFKYVPAHTSIYISARLDESDKESQRDGTNGTYVCISIKDEGPGIPLYEVPYLFDKFIRLQRDLSGSVRGSGLGLYISKQMVEVQGGRIWAESSGLPGEGALFCFTLPAVPPASSSS